MAEALGLASSVIAVVDVTGKAFALSIKLKALWDEVRDAPTLLLEKAEELQDLEDFFLDAEARAATTPIPKSLWNDAMIQKAVCKARAAMRDLQDAIDSLSVEVNDRRRYRRKLAAAKVVIKKDSLEAMERKLDRALSMYRLAQGLYCATMTSFCAAVIVERLPELPVSTTSNDMEMQIRESTSTKDGKGSAGGLQPSKPFLDQFTAKRKNVSEISRGPSFFGRMQFGFGDSGWSLSMRTPNWLTSTVYSVLSQRSASGWQVNLSSYPIIEDIYVGFPGIIGSDDLTSLQKHLHRRAVTPLVHDHKGMNLLHVACCLRAVKVAKWLLSIGLCPGYYYDWEDIETSQTHISPLTLVLMAGNYLIRSESSREILKLLLLYTPDEAVDCADLWGFLLHQKPIGEVRQMVSIIAPDYFSLELSIRLKNAYAVITQCHWALEDVLFLLPELDGITTRGFPEPVVRTALHLACTGLVTELLTPDGQRRREVPSEAGYQRVVGEVLKQSPQFATLAFGPEFMVLPVTPFAFFLCFVFNRIAGLAPEALEELVQSAVSLWTTCLQSNGINLLSYGRRERELYARGTGGRYPQQGSSPSSFWLSRNENCDISNIWCFRIFGITYGELPEQWRVWWALEDEGYAEDFWDSVKNPAGNIPGSWVEDCSDISGDDRAQIDFDRLFGAGGDVPPLIWSEYRKSRPPI